MVTFPLTFILEGQSYISTVLEISPPADYQWHIFLKDETLTRRFGSPFIIFHNKEKQEYQYGIPSVPNGSVFAHSVASSLRDTLFPRIAELSNY